MFVQNINIEEFRGIKKCKEPLKFTSFTVLIGRNNSGKSAILEALSLLPSPQRDESITMQSKIKFLRNLHRPNRPNQENNECLLYLYEGTSKIDFKLDNQIILTFKIEMNQIEESYDNKNIAFNPQTLVLYIPNETSIINAMENRIEDLNYVITKKGIHISVAKYLNKCVDDVYSEIILVKPILIRKVFSNQNTAYIKLKDLGSGAEKLIKFMSLIGALNPSLLLIDDFEVGFHPSLIKIFLEWLKEKDWQTVISTQSIDLLDKLTEVKPSNTTILQLHKSQDDILSYKSLDLEQLEALLDANTDPRLLVDALCL